MDNLMDMVMGMDTVMVILKKTKRRDGYPGLKNGGLGFSNENRFIEFERLIIKIGLNNIKASISK